MTIVPAYGRDYPDAASAIRDWIAGKDFIIQDVSCRWDGKYVNCQQVVEAKIRYNKLQDFAIVRLINGRWESEVSDD